MGSESSKEVYTEYLTRLSSSETIPHEDGFWKDLLSIPVHYIYADVDGFLAEFGKVAIENAASGNLRTLMKQFVRLASDVNNTESLTDATTAIFILRLFLKEMVENVDEPTIIDFFLAPDDPPEQPAGLHVLVKTLCSCLKSFVTDDVSYHLQVECVSALLTLLAIQMYSDRNAYSISVYRYLMAVENPELLLKALFENYISEACDEPSSESYSLTGRLWHMIGGKRRIQSRGDQLGDLSLWLILVLENHWTKGDNVFRQAIHSFYYLKAPQPAPESNNVAPAFHVDYEMLYSAICNSMDREGTALLLYSLLHENHIVRSYFLARPDFEQWVVPMLKTLYTRGETGSCHVYMCLIILLILTENTHFSRTVHSITLKNISWYMERSISEISLGGLIILVLVRTIYLNMRSMRDQYLHTNCLASLANMAEHFTSLHPFVCHKLISLFEVLSKKSQKLAERMQSSEGEHDNESMPSESESVTIQLGNGNGIESRTILSEKMQAQNLAVIQEILHMILTIINASLASQLQHNPNLVYALLHKKQVFEAYTNDPAFHDVVSNLEMVMNYFSERLEKQDGQLTEEEVINTIIIGSSQWPAHKLKPMEELKFKYVEDEKADSFFIPSVWAFIKSQTIIPFTSHNLKLFVIPPET